MKFVMMNLKIISLIFMFTLLMCFTKSNTCSSPASTIWTALNNKNFIIRCILRSSFLYFCSHIEQTQGFMLRKCAHININSCFWVITSAFTSQTKFECSKMSQENNQSELWTNIWECLRNLEARFCWITLSPSFHGIDLNALWRLLECIPLLHGKW